MPVYSGKIQGINFESIDAQSVPRFNFEPDEKLSQEDEIYLKETDVHWFHVYSKTTSRSSSFKIAIRGIFEMDNEGKSWNFFWYPHNSTEATRNDVASQLKRIAGIEDEKFVRIVWDPDPSYCGHFPDGRSSPRGSVFIFHTYYLPELVRKFFRNPDGTENYLLSEAIAEKITELYQLERLDLSGSKFSDAGGHERAIISDGYTFGIFKRHLHGLAVSSNGTPYFRRDNPKWLAEGVYLYSGAKPKGNSFHLRLSGHNLVEVRQEIRIQDIQLESDAFEPTIADLQKFLLRFRFPGPDDQNNASDYGNSAVLADIVQQFLLELIERLQNSQDLEPKIAKAILSVSGNPSEPIGNERLRYVVVLLDQLLCAKHPVAERYSIRPTSVYEEWSTIENILDGTLGFDQGSHKMMRPVAMSKTAGESSPNFATWSNEVCVFGPERCFIYIEPQTIVTTRRRVANYEDYWRCLIRGIQHTISLRSLILILESRSSRAAAVIPRLVELSKTYATRSSRQDNEEFDAGMIELSGNLAKIHRFLPGIREIAVATSAFSEGDVVKKFHFLNEECFHFSKVLGHIQQTVDELTGFLQFFQQQKQTKAEATIAKYLTFLGLLIAVLAILFSAPSFVEAYGVRCGNMEIYECLQQSKITTASRNFALFMSLFILVGCLMYSSFLPERLRSRITQILIVLIVLVIAIIGIFLGSISTT